MHSHNTWGISGPVFLTIFATASVACLVWALCDIYLARRIRLDDPIDRLTPTEIGMLVSDRNAYLAALTQLLTQGYIDSDGQPNPTPSRTKSRLDQLSRTTLEVLRNQSGKRKDVARTTRSARVDLRNELRVRGYLTEPSARGVRIALALFMVIGVIRMFAGLSNAKPTGLLVAVLVVDMMSLMFVSGLQQRRTIRGDKALDAARSRNRHLRPELRPAVRTYGPTAAAIGVALFGIRIVELIDPLFAANATVSRGHIAASWGTGGYFGGGFDSTSSCSTSSSCGSSSSCGGGGGGCGG